jgi:Flp pilus assembly protein TadB
VELAVVALSLACLFLALAVTALGCTVPWLWWRCMRLEEKVERLDEVLAEVLKSAGMDTEVGGGRGVRG